MKTIIITVRNTFLQTELAKYILPYNPKKAMFGWYSDFWKTQRLIHANVEKIDKNFIRAKIAFEEKQTDRMKIIFPSGAGLDAPFNLKAIDCDIIGLHLEALRLAKFGYRNVPKTCA